MKRRNWKSYNGGSRGFDAGKAIRTRFETEKKSPEYKHAYTDIIISLQKEAIQIAKLPGEALVAHLKEKGGITAIIKEHINKATENIPLRDLGLFGKDVPFTKEALLEETQEFISYFRKILIISRNIGDKITEERF